MSSGPTGGVVAAARAADAAGLGDVVSVDMGGTSYDVCLIRDGARRSRRIGTGGTATASRLPMVDIHSIGAGGGLAEPQGQTARSPWGPSRQGASRAPSATAGAGREPTVTDADLVLGRLDPDAFWSGRLRPRRRRGAHGPWPRSDEPSGLDAEETAVASGRRSSTPTCADAVRRILSLAGCRPARTRPRRLRRHGRRPRRSPGCVCSACAGSSIPQAAPAFSALGLLTANHVVDDTRATLDDWRDIDLRLLTKLADDLEAAADSKLELAGVKSDRRRYEWALHLVYPGQTFDVSIPVERTRGVPFTREAIARAAEELHRRNEAARLIEARSQEPVVRGVRLIATGLVDQPRTAVRGPSAQPRPVGARRVYTGARWVDDTPVYRSGDLGEGSEIAGPALIQGPFTTVVLAGGDRAETLASGDLLVHVARV